MMYVQKHVKNDWHNALLQFMEIPRVTYFTGLYEKLTTDFLVKHGFPSTRDVYLMHGSNGVFLPRGCNGTIFFSFWPLDHLLFQHHSSTRFGRENRMR